MKVVMTTAVDFNVPIALVKIGSYWAGVGDAVDRSNGHEEDGISLNSYL